jgi:flagellar basal-body rod protein FlgC
MDVIAQNIANASTTRDSLGFPNPYRRKEVIFQTGSALQGVRVSSIVSDMSQLKKVYEPGHPDAIPDGPDKGYVLYPNVEPIVEMVDMLEATRAYEANATVMDATKTIMFQALRIIA